MQSPTHTLALAPLDSLDGCEHQCPYYGVEEDGMFTLYHLCEISKNGTERCKYPARQCRVKEEDELFSNMLEEAARNALRKITQDNLKEGIY